jgi:predicted helicase
MYAQTIAYGLFAARCEEDYSKDFSRQQAAYLIPKTNPFLRKLFNYIAGPELDESITWAVDDLAQILAWADMEAVLKNFGKSTGKSDPVVHFYETFLKEYDPKTREMRGVYYTPLPVVSYIVRSIDHILKTSFNKPQGLADPSVLVLDPAVGTATFLYMVMQEIHDAVIKQGQGGIWDDYVAKKLLPRLFGFELLMAPYAIAHLKLGRLLKETGYQFQTDQRLGIYLTNTLEEAVKHAETMFAQWITEEANAAADIKKTKPIIVVLGNPPYSGASANKGKWAKELVQRYYQVDGAPLGEKNPKWLQDDYVKFLAFGQWRIEKTGSGVLGFITNHSYLDNPTFRGMRQSLMGTFTDIYIYNLHGNSKKKEAAPDGGKDENVFDIQQGVSIGIFVKEAGISSPAKIHYADLWGKREGKYSTLSETDISITDWTDLKPANPNYLFIPQNQNLLPEYQNGWDITDISPVNVMGIQTHRDNLVTDLSAKSLNERINDLVDQHLTDDEIKDKFNISDTEQWSLFSARAELNKDPNWQNNFTYCLYRPFDSRPFFYHKALVDRTRTTVIRNIVLGSHALLLPRGVGGKWQHAFVSSQPCVDVAISSASREANQVFPLYIYPSEGEMQLDGGARRPNLNPEFIKIFSEKLELKFILTAKGIYRKPSGRKIFLIMHMLFFIHRNTVPAMRSF